jgi:tetratricopeptide (TPR) repeat protein
LKAGGAGITVANKAQAIYANYLERSEKTKLALFQEVAARAEARLADDPEDPNAHYWLAYSLGRYSQGISVAKALAQGLGPKVKAALETTIRLAPTHADAHIALGTFHAEVIDKVGKLLGRTQGADSGTGLKLFQKALGLNPTSAIAMIEYANGLVMLEGDKRMKEAEKLYASAARCQARDAMERLEVEMAKAELED